MVQPQSLHAWRRKASWLNIYISELRLTVRCAFRLYGLTAGRSVLLLGEAVQLRDGHDVSVTSLNVIFFTAAREGRRNF